MAKKSKNTPNINPVQSKQPAAKPAPSPSRPQRPVSNAAAVAPRNIFTIRNLCIALAILAFALYANTLGNKYVLDDTMVIKENMYVHQGFKGIPELLATPHMRGYMVIPNDLYRPLSLVMFAIEYQLFGLNPFWGHFFNILTFMGCVVALFLFLDKFFAGRKTAVAFIGAFIFAVHPLHTEVVANIKSRDELLCYFLAFCSLNVFMNYMKSGKPLQLIIGAVLFFLSLISKETAITLIAIIPLLFFFYDNKNRSRAIFITVGSVAATAIFMVIRMVVLAKYNANQPAAIDFIDNALTGAPSAASRIATEWYIMGKYLWLMFIPYPLLSNYSFKSIPFMSFGDIGVLASIAAYAFLIFFAVFRFIKDKKDPWVFAIVFYFATISLFSNFPFLMGAEMAERFTFFATTGICIAGAVAIDRFILKADALKVNSIMSGKVLMILAPLLLVFGGMTFARNFDWKDEYTLYKTDQAKSPDDCRLYQYLATSMAETVYNTLEDSTQRKELDKESVGYLKKALEIDDSFAEAHVELGRVYERLRMYDAAVAENKRALALKPFNATANNNMGSVLMTLGHYREAIPYLQRSVEYNPNFMYVYLNLARCYKQLQVWDSSATYYKQMLQFAPNFPDGVKELATVYFMRQKYDSAAIYFKQVADMTPQDADAANNLGAVYLNSKQFGPAIQQFQRAISLNANYLNAYSNLARAYYLSGQYQQAIDMINKELSLNPKFVKDVPFIALSYQKMGKMDEARKYEAIAKKIYSDFKLE